MLRLTVRPATMALTTAVLVAGSSPAFAQTSEVPAVIAGFAWAAHWDDETFLGRGPMISGGLRVPIWSGLAAEGEVAWASHHRDSGTLVADGTPVVGTGRLMFSFRGNRAGARPFVSGGLAVVRSTGTFTSQFLVPGPDGRPVLGPEIRQDWRTTQTGWEIGAGVDVGTTGRLSWRPELRWTATTSDPSFQPGSLEPPLWIIRGGVTIGWRLR